MNTRLLAAVFTLLLICGLTVGYFATRGGDKESPSTTPGGTIKRTTITDACKVLTQTIAEQTLGQPVQPGQNGAQTSSDDLVVSTCTYTTKASTSADLQNVKSITILTRSAKTKTGEKSNKDQFSSQKPVGVANVDGYGSAAFWNSQYGQLNILKNGTWYVLSIGGSSVSDRNIDEAKKLADAIDLENKVTHE